MTALETLITTLRQHRAVSASLRELVAMEHGLPQTDRQRRLAEGERKVPT